MNIIPVEFPNGGVNAAAVLTVDGAWKIYVNTLAPEPDHMAAARELIEQMA